MVDMMQSNKYPLSYFVHDKLDSQVSDQIILHTYIVFLIIIIIILEPLMRNTHMCLKYVKLERCCISFFKSSDLSIIPEFPLD